MKNGLILQHSLFIIHLILMDGSLHGTETGGGGGRYMSRDAQSGYYK